MKVLTKIIGLMLCLVIVVSLTGVQVLGAELTADDIKLGVKSAVTANSLYYGGLYEPVAGIYFGASYEEDTNIQASNGSRYDIEKINNLYPKKNSAYLMHLDFGSPVEEIQTSLELADDADVAVVLVWETNKTYASMADYKTYIQDTVSYLRWLDVPVFISYGARMNNSAITNASQFIANYRYVAELTRDVASDVALVWTVDDGKTSNIDSFYPGDAYVDWIGISSFLRPGDDSLDSIGQIVYKYGNYKPVMLTEVGVARYDKTTLVSNVDWAASQLRKLYSYLPIAYPQIKGIFLQNGIYEGDRLRSYDVYGDDDMMDAYNEAVAVDVFMEDLAQSGMYRFAELETRKDPAISVEGTKMELYTILDTNELEDYVVKYYIDGRKVGETSDVPYRHSLQIGGLSDERHTLNVQVYTGKTMMAERNFTVVANDDGALIESSAYKVIHFEDIRSHWSEQYVIEVSKRGLVVGSNGVFRPDDLISRAEMTSVITKLGKLPTGGTVSFTDVGAGKWYHQYVGNASKYLVGYGSKYYPERNATREEIITAIVKMKGYNVSNITQKDRDDFNKKFWDHYQISPENKDYMILAVKYDIIGGYADGTLKPKNNMKRGEVAKVLYTTFYQ